MDYGQALLTINKYNIKDSNGILVGSADLTIKELEEAVVELLNEWDYISYIECTCKEREEE